MKKRKLTDVGLLSLKHTLECGQCFRWNKESDNSYFGVVRGIPAVLSEENGIVRIETDGELSFWREYFDLDRDYDKAIGTFGEHPFTLAAIEFGKGLRILRQEYWETLCSYVISQCNNIPRISSIVSGICASQGDKLDFRGKTCYSFPSPEKLAALDEADFRALGTGFRAKYLKSAANAVVDKVIDFESIAKMTMLEVREKLMSLPGIGPKVADCVLLFGLGKMDAFPVDTWMKKAASYYGGKLDGADFGQYAGIAQEFIFHYIRNLEQS